MTGLLTNNSLGSAVVEGKCQFQCACVSGVSGQVDSLFPGVRFRRPDSVDPEKVYAAARLHHRVVAGVLPHRRLSNTQ